MILNDDDDDDDDEKSIICMYHMYDGMSEEYGVRLTKCHTEYQ